MQELVLAFGWLAPSVAKEALGISALKQLLDALLGVELFRIQILKKQVCELEFVVDRSIGHDPSLDAGGFESVSVLASQSYCCLPSVNDQLLSSGFSASLGCPP